jgi:RNA polymerase sigma-70 factor (ECF subfamily)
MAYYIALKFCGNHTMAEEAAQETIYKAIQHIDQLKEKEKLEQWIKVIAKNTVLEILKKSNKIIPMEHPENSAIMEENQIYFEDDGEIINTVQEILATMKEPYRTIMHFYYYNGYKISEISAALAISEGTVKSLLSRGRSIIKKNLLSKIPIETNNYKGLKK